MRTKSNSGFKKRLHPLESAVVCMKKQCLLLSLLSLLLVGDIHGAVFLLASRIDAGDEHHLVRVA